MLKIADKQIELTVRLLRRGNGRKSLRLRLYEFDRVKKMPIKTRLKNDDETVKHLKHGPILP